MSGYPHGVSLSPATTSMVAVSAAAVAVVALVLGLVAQVRLRRLRRAYTVLQAGDGETSFVEAAARTSREVDGLRRDVAVLSAGLDDARADLADAIRHVAVVRYDAFGDMGGRLSFSVALLDDSGDGLVLTSITGRTETRTYAKGVKRGTREASLSPEEEQVVGWALRGVPARPGPRRRPPLPRRRSRNDGQQHGRRAYAYLGPTGTFTEAALLAYLESAGGPGRDGVTLAPYPTVPTALDAVRDGAVVAAMVPLENSVEGSVPTTIDELAVGRPLVIAARLHLPVTFALLARPGTPLERRHAPSPATRRRTCSAAAGCASTCRRPRPSRRRRTPPPRDWSPTAAGTPRSPPRSPRARTASTSSPTGCTTFPAPRPGSSWSPRRSRPSRRPASDKTSLVLYIGQDHPGALLEILTEFAVRGINLTRIESRPTGGGIGDYFFSVDAEGHVDDARVGEALMGLRRVCADVRYLGSYPRADAVRPTLRRGVSDAEYDEAQAWLARVRDGRA